jgi:arsenate reductase (thioredoxin)
MPERIFNVLFLCTGNSARSIMAEALLGRLGAEKFNAWSAGSKPKGRVHPMAMKLLKELGHKTEHFRSKSWDEFSGQDAPKFDFIFTVCDNAANETCPIWPGHPVTAHWGIPDPDGKYTDEQEEYQAFFKAYQQLEKRIKQFIALPFETLDQDSLKTRLINIGKNTQI